MRYLYSVWLVAALNGLSLNVLGHSKALADDTCIDPKTVVGATYLISGSSDKTTKEFTVLRERAGRMVYLLSTDKLTRIYEHYGDDRIAVTEYYDLEGIGIEYAPAKNENVGWDSIYEFFPESNAKGTDITGSGQWRCLETETREGSVAAGNLTATFITDIHLPLDVHETSEKGSVDWQLTAIHTDDKLLKASLERVDGYKSYDFADLGDSENEDFFRNSEWLKYKLHGPEGDGHSH